MFDERAFIAKVESSGTEELLELLKRPTLEEEKALRAHLGDARYQRMHSMALRKSNVSNFSRSIAPQAKRNVVVIHGIMGGELTTMNRSGAGEQVWVKAFRIMTGWLSRLRLNDDGSGEYDSEYDVYASGIMKRYYGELLLSLSGNCNVRAFWFDWRKDLQVAANDLDAKINGWFGDRPVHLVAHSMGGLVARTFIKKFPKRWETMKDPDRMQTGGRLVMLGTPNHGSFSIPQVITGIEGLVRKLTVLDFRHNSAQLLEVFNSFVGTYQMLPSPLVTDDQEVSKLYESGTYRGYNVPQRHLDNALRHHKFLSEVITPERLVYVAGTDQPTFHKINNYEKLGEIKSYDLTRYGDGRVPHEFGLLNDVKTYYIREEHGNLSSNGDILDALDDLLATGETTATAFSKEAFVSSRAVNDQAARMQLEEDLKDDIRQLEISRSRMGTRVVNPIFADDARAVVESPDDELKKQKISPEERKVEENLTRSFLGTRDESQSASESDEATEAAFSDIKKIRIEISLSYGGIQDVHAKKLRTTRGKPLDAIAVGHYIGVKPQYAVKALDVAISRSLPGQTGAAESDIPEQDLILTQYTNRGIIHGRLGQLFFMPDTRQTNGGARASQRVIVIAGMGESGRFGVPELTVMVRELCWSLGRMGKRHLATVLIGAGQGNIKQRDAIAAWIDGIKRAVVGSKDDDKRRLDRITFVEYDPRNIRVFQNSIIEELERQKELKDVPTFVYQPISEAKLDELKKAEKKWDEKDWEQRRTAGDPNHSLNDIPTRVTLGLDAERKTYRFGAITASASVPEREIMIDPAVIWQANDELAGEQKPGMQLERGRFLEELLMPDDLRRELYNNAPLVMMLDSTTARIHWEMVAQPEVGAMSGRELIKGAKFDEKDFLGTSRGFTRQLRTTFAPPPEPPPPPRRILRVLVVADPAADAHLPGAQEEGVAVADLFEGFNTIYKDIQDTTRVEVTRLFGPLEATRTNVLRELMVRSYDVLHFAGHCVYQWGGDPTLSGWIFNVKNKELLTANELKRIDRIPKFVFSNACESGITPDRSQDRTVDLAPSFAEAFFARGVSNFVCTAWPVNDVAARTFALRVYSGLLGIKLDKNHNADGAGQTQQMHEAMRDARCEIASSVEGISTWGAYQHYGNPYFQLFNVQKPSAPSQPATARRKGTASKGKRQAASTTARKKTSRKR